MAKTMLQIRESLRSIIQIDKKNQRITPEGVAAFAALHLQNDVGEPITPAPHHWLWLRLFCDERIRRLVVIAPPESAKTTWMISAFVGCYIGIWPERSVIIGSTSGSVAEKRSVSLRAMVEGAEWQKTFPGVLPVTGSEGLRWEIDSWSIAPDGKPHAGRIHPTVSSYGTGGSIIGSRADLVIGDDLLDFDSSRTEHQRNTVEQWFHNSMLSRRKARTGRAILIGTSWHFADLYSKASKTEGWVTCKMKLLSETPEVYAELTYPSDWPHEKFGEPATELQKEV